MHVREHADPQRVRTELTHCAHAVRRREGRDLEARRVDLEVPQALLHHVA